VYMYLHFWRINDDDDDEYSSKILRIALVGLVIFKTTLAPFVCCLPVSETFYISSFGNIFDLGLSVLPVECARNCWQLAA